MIYLEIPDERAVAIIDIANKRISIEADTVLTGETVLDTYSTHWGEVTVQGPRYANHDAIMANLKRKPDWAVFRKYCTVDGIESEWWYSEDHKKVYIEQDGRIEEGKPSENKITVSFEGYEVLFHKHRMYVNPYYPQSPSGTHYKRTIHSTHFGEYEARGWDGIDPEIVMKPLKKRPDWATHRRVEEGQVFWYDENYTKEYRESDGSIETEMVPRGKVDNEVDWYPISFDLGLELEKLGYLKEDSQYSIKSDRKPILKEERTSKGYTYFLALYR